MKKVGLLLVLLLFLTSAWSQSRQIKGRVVDKSTGSPLADVSVTIKGSNSGTLTDKNGNFTLTATGTEKVEIEISSVSYGTQRLTVDGLSDITVSMDKETKSMDEVVVVGYGSVRKRDLTGAVASIKEMR